MQDRARQHPQPAFAPRGLHSKPLHTDQAQKHAAEGSNIGVRLHHTFTFPYFLMINFGPGISEAKFGTWQRCVFESSLENLVESNLPAT